MKKAQGLSVNIIIIAAIALIVLVVLVAIFTGRLGIFTKGLQETGDPTKGCNANEQGFNFGVAEVVGDSCPEGKRRIMAKVPQGHVCCTT